MSYFPLCVDLTGATVLLVGSGPQIQEKRERLTGFGANLRCLDRLEERDLLCDPAMVVIGDLERQEAERCSSLCRRKRIPVNVVDVPDLCTFIFPALIRRGDLTVGITTGGKSPGFAAILRRKLEGEIPRNAGAILTWLYQLRPRLKRECSETQFRRALKAATGQSMALDRPLTGEEVEAILRLETRAETPQEAARSGDC